MPNSDCWAFFYSQNIVVRLNFAKLTGRPDGA